MCSPAFARRLPGCFPLCRPPGPLGPSFCRRPPWSSRRRPRGNDGGSGMRTEAAGRGRLGQACRDPVPAGRAPSRAWPSRPRPGRVLPRGPGPRGDGSRGPGTPQVEWPALGTPQIVGLGGWERQIHEALRLRTRTSVHAFPSCPFFFFFFWSSDFNIITLHLETMY